MRHSPATSRVKHWLLRRPSLKGPRRSSSVEHLEQRHLLAGDFNTDGQLDQLDIDRLTEAVRREAYSAEFDLDSDGRLTDSDRVFWVERLKQTYFGDSNIDGEFSTRDLVTVFQAGEYEDQLAQNSNWLTGDWNGDGEFTTRDVVHAFQSGGYEVGPRGPQVDLEPSTISSVERDVLLDGFEHWANWIATLTTVGDFAKQLPLIGTSVADIVDVAGVLQTDVMNAIRASLTRPSPDSNDVVQGLQQIGRSADGLTVQVQQASGGRVSAQPTSELQFQLQMSIVDVRQRTVDFASDINLHAALKLLDVQLESSEIQVVFDDPAVQAEFDQHAIVVTKALFPAINVGKEGEPTFQPVEAFDGHPDAYLLRVINPRTINSQFTVAERPSGVGGYELRLNVDITATSLVTTEVSNATITSGALGAQSVAIPLGDINGDGYDDMVTSVIDELGSVLDLEAVPPKATAYVTLGGPDSIWNGVQNQTLVLQLPAPILKTSNSFSRSVFVQPGDYNNDGIDDIAISDWNGSGPFELFQQFLSGGLHIVYGSRQLGGGSTINLFDEADVVVERQDSNRTMPASSGGDVTGDGIDDIITLRAPGIRPSEVEVLAGGPDELRSVLGITAEGGSLLGVGIIGDINNDGTADMAVVANHTNQDRIYLFWGGGIDENGGPSTRSITSADRVIATPRPLDAVTAVRRLGDLNADGQDDFAIEDSRGILLVPGSAINENQVISIDGQWDVHGVGDVNGDGFADLAISSLAKTPPLSAGVGANPWVHQVGGLLLGSDDAIRRLESDRFETPEFQFEPARGLFSNVTAATLDPHSFGGIGDLNGDGRPDLALAEPLGGRLNVYFSPERMIGQVGPLPAQTRRTREIHQLATVGLAPVSLPLAEPLTIDASARSLNLETATYLEGEFADSSIADLEAIGDINGDSFPDYAVADRFRTYIMLGPYEFDQAQDVSTIADIVFENQQLGVLSNRPGDINGDGVDDLIFAEPQPNNGHSDVTILFGRRDLPNRLDSAAISAMTQGAGDDYVVLVIDLELDGDYTISALNFDGDELDDVLITGTTASGWASHVFTGRDVVNDQDPFEGHVLAVPDPASPTTIALEAYPSIRRGHPCYAASGQEQPTCFQRDDRAIANVVGDVNGDGLEDVLISVPGFVKVVHPDYDIPDIGRAYLLLGRATPVGRIDLRMADQIYQDFSLGGNSLALGDLDNDGFDDFAMSRTREDGELAEGSMLVFRGSSELTGRALTFANRMTSAQLLDAHPGAEISLTASSSIAAESGELRLVGSTAAEINEQIFYLPETSLTAGPFVFDVVLRNDGGSNQNVGVRVGVNNILFHTNHAGGAFRVETDGQPRPANIDMGYTPAANTQHRMRVEGDGTGNFRVTIFDRTGPNPSFTYQFSSPESVGGRLGLRREARGGGTARFASTVVRAPVIDPGASADLIVRQVEASSLAGRLSVVTAPFATSGDFDHDGKLDLAIGQPVVSFSSNAEIGDAANVVDRDDRGVVHVYYDASRLFAAGEVVLTRDDHQTIRGKLPQDQLGTLAQLPGIDVNHDEIDDLIIGAAGADGAIGGIAQNAGRIYPIYGARTSRPLPDAALRAETLSNREAAGIGSVLIDDGNSISVSRTLEGNQSERWFQFITLGDGTANDSINVLQRAIDFEIYDDRGASIAAKLDEFDFATLESGHYYIRLSRRPGVPLSTPLPFSLQIDAPVQSAATVHAESNRDVVFGGEGDDLLIADDDLDYLFD